ncbi:DNA-binding response regulator [Streptomyces sp. NPDC008313]|uniref:response regulator transcription factor n=1 Tax=Streptomyces sp. NPDC008313 TaxID=3364826 RepID=UPI0036EFDF3F
MTGSARRARTADRDHVGDDQGLLHGEWVGNRGRTKIVVRVGILGRQALERAGVKRVLEVDERIRIVGEDSVDRASHVARTSRPDVLVTSHHSPKEALEVLRSPAAAAQRMAHASVPAPAHVVLVGHLSEHSTRILLRHGARGILLRGDSLRHLPWAVRAAAAGTIALGPVAAQFLVDQYLQPSRAADDVAAARGLLRKLSSREREILHLMADGVSTPAMAATLGISTHTVKDHIRGVYTKLDVDNRVHASRIVWQAQVPAAHHPTDPLTPNATANDGPRRP